MSIGGATYDLFVQVNHEIIENKEHERVFSLPLGAKVRVQGVIETCGGGASNTSVGLSRLGCKAHFEGVISSDQWGEKLLANLQAEGVDTSLATVVEGEVSSFSIILSASEGERVILYEPGTNVHLHKANFDREVVGEMDWVYLNHIQEGSSAIQDDIVKILTDQRIHLTWNPGGGQIDVGLDLPSNRLLIRNTDLLLLNREEALAFSRTKSIEEALATLIGAGTSRVCITDGKNGAFASDGTHTYFCPCDRNARVVNTTGAGDAFGTGVTWALTKHFDFPTALKAGTINAASVVGAIGAQKGLLTETQMKERLETTSLAVDVRPR
jgi:sugar/nucleoside kinase (ribokinase family)